MYFVSPHQPEFIINKPDITKQSLFSWNGNYSILNIFKINFCKSFFLIFLLLFIFILNILFFFYGFGLGFGVLTNSADARDALSIGSYTWGGAFGTLYWADPVEDLIGILLIQIRPYTHLGIRPMFSNVVTQAVIDGASDQEPRVMGRPTPH